MELETQELEDLAVFSLALLKEPPRDCSVVLENTIAPSPQREPRPEKAGGLARYLGVGPVLWGVGMVFYG